jgi:hypothetical protein
MKDMTMEKATIITAEDEGTIRTSSDRNDIIPLWGWLLIESTKKR